MGSSQSILDEIQRGLEKDCAEDVRLALTNLEELVRIVKASKKEPNKWQLISYNLHQAQFKEAYKQLLQKKAHDSQAEAFLTEFAKLQHQWNLIINPKSYTYST